MIGTNCNYKFASKIATIAQLSDFVLKLKLFGSIRNRSIFSSNRFRPFNFYLKFYLTPETMVIVPSPWRVFAQNLSSKTTPTSACSCYVDSVVFFYDMIPSQILFYHFRSFPCRFCCGYPIHCRRLKFFNRVLLMDFYVLVFLFLMSFF